MKKTRIHRVWILFLLSIMACLQVRAQYMPVVFDKKYGDKEPFRTYKGMKYQGGISDHLPIYVDFNLILY